MTSPARWRPVRHGRDRGALWLIEADEVAVGDAALCFGSRIEPGGRDVFLDELYVEEALCGQGIGAHALRLVQAEAARLGVRAVHREAGRDHARAGTLDQRARLVSRERFHLTTAAIGN